MKKYLTFPVCVVALQLAGFSSSADAQAAQKIAVLDLVAAHTHSLAGKSIMEQFKVYRKAFQKDAEAEQKKFQAAQNELRMQRSLLSPEAMQAREQKFKDEFEAAQRRLQERRRALDESRIKASKTFDDNLKEVLKKLRAERKFDIILRKRPSVVFADPSVDITGEVLKRMNARIKKIPVKNPGK